MISKKLLLICTIAALFTSTEIWAQQQPDGGPGLGNGFAGPGGGGGGGQGGFGGGQDFGGPGGGGGGGRGRGRGGRGGPGGFQGGGFQQDDGTDIKQLLRATDEEWKVISPLLQKVVAAQQLVDAAQNSNGADNSGFGGPGGPGGGGGGRGGPGGGPGGNDPFSGPSDSAGGGRGGRGGGGRGGRGGGGFGGPGGGGGFGQGDFTPPNATFVPPDPQIPAVQISTPQIPPSPGTSLPQGTTPAIAPSAGAAAAFPPSFQQGISTTQAIADLRTALADPNTSNDKLKELLAVVRTARKKAQTDLAAAQKDLLQLLTPDQQAALAGLGYID